jgi:carboxylesterase type B
MCLSLLLHFAVAAALLCLSVAQAVAPPQVQLSCGTVVGTWDPDDEQVAAFYSIPYGQPPIAQARWKPPQKAQCWTDQPLNATAPGYICWQLFDFPDCLYSPPQSEDCLTLDVYTPVLGLNRSLPVMAWLYGGSLVAGSTTSYINLKAFAETHQVVLVAISYRLNAFGFLAHPALVPGDERGVSGNYGLLDQQMGLTWIQDNIQAFGGDPSRVTLIGQSSGGTSIFALLTSPASVGLFHGAISLSGSPNITIDLQSAYEQNDAMLKTRTKCWSSDLQAMTECLYALSAVEVSKMFPESFNVGAELPKATSGQFYPGLPVIDGVTLATDLLTALKTPIMDVPLIVQSMMAEWDMFSPNKTIYDMTVPQYQQFLHDYFASHGWESNAGDIVFELYAQQANESIELAYQQFFAEQSELCGSIEVAITAAEGFKSPVYLSVVTHNPSQPLHTIPGTLPSRYAGHMWDYIMATHSWDFFSYCTAHLVPTYHPNADDVAVGVMLMDQWTNLTTYGSITSFGSRVQTVDSVSGFPNSYNMIVQGDNGPSVDVNYASTRCSTMASPPLNLNQSFWLCD